jgi:16S rRNA (cytidine1402-2'-O)-methyltransferase
MGTLYIVSTPIGNLEDLSFRAVQILFNVKIIAAEDTRRTRGLLEKISEGIKTIPHMVSYYEQNEQQRIPEVISFLKNDMDIALVSDAGTPAISDPGFKLIRECIREKIKVISVPGPSSVIAALTSSGLPTDKFVFVGYPPRKPGHRKTFFENIKTSQESLKTTVILFEAPHKMKKSLMEMQEIFGDIDVVLARELTKMHEEIRREKISKSLEHFKKKEPRGEYVILFNLNV